MCAVRKNQYGKYVLSGDYEINTVHLTRPEEEHSHEFIELVYTLSGKGTHRVDGKEYHVRNGDLLVINFHHRHTVFPTENLTYVDVMLKPEYVSEALKGTEDLFLLLKLNDFADLSEHVRSDNLLLHFDPRERKKLEFLLEITREEQEKTLSAANLILHSSLAILLSYVFRKMAESQPMRISINDRLLSYIRESSGTPLKIAELAARCGYTTEHFSRRFKNFTGVSPACFVMNCRLDKAKEELLQTEKSVEIILAECGFSNRTSFFQKFRARFGITPLQLRKNQK